LGFGRLRVGLLGLCLGLLGLRVGLFGLLLGLVRLCVGLLGLRLGLVRLLFFLLFLLVGLLVLLGRCGRRCGEGLAPLCSVLAEARRCLGALVRGDHGEHHLGELHAGFCHRLHHLAALGADADLLGVELVLLERFADGLGLLVHVGHVGFHLAFFGLLLDFDL